MLDGNLGDGGVTPVAIKLIADAVPVIIYSGVGIPESLEALHPDVPVFQKPLDARKAMDLLANRISSEKTDLASACNPVGDVTSVWSAI